MNEEGFSIGDKVKVKVKVILNKETEKEGEIARIQKIEEVYNESEIAEYLTNTQFPRITEFPYVYTVKFDVPIEARTITFGKEKTKTRSFPSRDRFNYFYDQIVKQSGGKTKKQKNKKTKKQKNKKTKKQKK